MSTGFYFLMPTLPVYIVEHLHAHKGQVGYVLAAYTLSAIIIRPFTGYFIDSFGRKTIYLISFLLFAATFAVYPFAGTFVLLLFLRFFHGFLWGIAGTSGATLIVDVIPPLKRGQGIGIYGISMTIAMATGPVLALWIMGENNYKSMFFSSSAVAISGFLLLLFVRYPRFQPTEKQKFTFRNIVATEAIPMAIVQLLFGITYGAVISFITLYAKDIHITQTSPFFLMIAGGIFISRLWSGRIFDRNGPKYLIISAILFLISGFTILSTVQNIPGFYISAFLIGIGSGIIMPTLQAMSINVVDKNRRGAANATIITAIDLGIGIGSVLLGFLSEKIGLSLTYFLCAIILLSGLIYFLLYGLSFYQKNQIAENS